MSRLFLLLLVVCFVGCSHRCTLTPHSSDRDYARVNRKARRFCAKTGNVCLSGSCATPSDRSVYLTLMDGRELEVCELQMGRLNSAYTLSGAAASEAISTWDIQKVDFVSTSESDFTDAGVGVLSGTAVGVALAAMTDDTTRSTVRRINQTALLITGGAMLGGAVGWIAGHYLDEEDISIYTVKMDSAAGRK